MNYSRCMLLNECTCTIYCATLKLSPEAADNSWIQTFAQRFWQLMPITDSSAIDESQSTFCQSWLVCKMCMPTKKGIPWAQADPLFSRLSQSTGLDNLWADGELVQHDTTTVNVTTKQLFLERRGCEVRCCNCTVDVRRSKAKWGCIEDGPHNYLVTRL